MPPASLYWVVIEVPELNASKSTVVVTALAYEGSTSAEISAAQGRSDDLSYEANDFKCIGVRRSDAALARVDWTCLRGSDFIRFGTT